MRAAILQTDIAFEDKEKNLRRAGALIETAADGGADICFFPEMSFTGFSMNLRLTGESDFYTVNIMRGLAAKHATAIGFGYTAIRDGKGENRYAVADKRGDIVSDYTKLHSFAIGGEREDFRQGDAMPVPFRLAGHSISTFICYDLRFPELFRAAADASTVMVVAANWPDARRGHWETLLRARAIENQAYMIGVNRVGSGGGIYYSGASMAVDPNGAVTASAEDGAEQLLFAELPADTERRRAEFPALKSRRQELYRGLIG